MVYEEKKDKVIYFYNVTYDEEKLKRILEKLEKYSYVSISRGQMGGSVTRWPVTKKNIQKRVSSLFHIKYNSNATILPETIEHHIENDNDFITFEYSFEKMPDLYCYIDVILNKANIMKYASSFGYGMLNLNMNNMLIHSEQFALEGILNYINSQELVNHHLKNDVEINDKEYDYKGLNELYNETLECLNFTLIATKEYLENPKAVSVLSLQRKK